MKFTRTNTINYRLKTSRNLLLLLPVFLLQLLFTESLFAQACTEGIVPPGTVNGIDITVTSSGSVDLYPSPFTSCSNVTTPANSLYLGASGPFSYTMNFSQPVNDILIVITATGNILGENFVFTSNAGIPSISTSNSCFSVITGNEILSGAASGPQGGGGEFIITAPSAFTSLTITGLGGEAGSLLTVCASSIVIPSCTIASLTPTISQTSACLTTSSFDLTTITSSNIPAGTTFGWYSASPASAATVLANPTSVTTGTYYGAFYDAVNDCYSLTQAVTINPEPVAALTAPSVCSGASMAFTDQSTVSSGSITTWAWDFGDGGTSTTQNPTHTYNGAGANFTTTLTVTSAQGCSNTITQQVTTIEAPVAAFSSTVNCVNDPVVFTDQSTVSFGSITNWNWNFGDGNTSSLQNPTNLYSTASTFNVTLIVTSNNGCTNTITQQITPSAPIAAYTYTSGCLNSLTNFTDQSTINTGSIVNWNWDFGDGSVGTTQNASHTYSTTGSFTVVLTITSNLGCTSTSTQQVSVSPMPVAAFTAPSECSNAPVVFTDQSTISSGTITNWSWSFGDGGSSTSQNPSHLFGTGGTFPVSLTVTSNAGCSNTVIVPINLLTSPNAGFVSTPSKPDILNPIVDFINSTTGGTSYSWDFGGIGTSTQFNPSFTFPESVTNYTVTLIAYNGTCTDTARATIAINDILIYYVPNAFTPDGDEFNQTFQPVFTAGFDPFDFNMQLFNRWGETIFESNDATVGWDGSYHGMLVPDGIYTWRIEFKTTASDERVILVGHVSKVH